MPKSRDKATKSLQPFQPESVLIKGILFMAPEFNSVLFRNTVGMFQTKIGHPIKTGLCTGSSDLIGWTSIVIDRQSYGVFTAIEAKTKRTKITDAQINFIKQINDAGGIGFFVYTVHEYSVLMAQAIRSFIEKRQ